MLPGSEGEEGRRGGELRVTRPQACHVIGNVHTTPHVVNEEAPVLLPSTHTPPVKPCRIVTHFIVRKSLGLQTLVMILQWSSVQMERSVCMGLTPRLGPYSVLGLSSETTNSKKWFILR